MRRKNVKDIAGLGTILLWQWLTVLRGPLFPSVAGVRFLGAEGGFAIFTLVLFSVFLLLALKGKSLPEVWFVRSVRAAPFLMGFAWLPWAVWGENQPLPLLFLALVLPPAGSAVHLAGWQWRLSRAPFSRQAVVFGLACLLRSAAILPLSFAALPLLSGFAILLPFLGNSLWSPPENELSPGIPLRSREAFRLSPRLALRVASFFIISAMFLSILLSRKSGEAITPQVLTDPFYTLGALAAGLVLLRWFSADLRSIYFFAQSLLAMGFIVFAALGTARPTVPLALLQLGFGTFGAYIFTLLLYLGSRTGRSEALSVVASIQAVISGSVLLGMLLTRTTGLAAGATGVPFVLASSLLGMALLFFSTLFLRDDPTSFAGYGLHSAAVEECPSHKASMEPPGSKGEAKAREESLFPRLLEQGLSLQEIRVAQFVAEGLANAEISQCLNITANTVRSHLRKIHKKIGSSNRKTLIDEIAKMHRRT